VVNEESFIENDKHAMQIKKTSGERELQERLLKIKKPDKEKRVVKENKCIVVF